MHLYLHVPFCARRCAYCDFAIAVRRVVPAETYTDLLLQEWAGWQGHEAWHASPQIHTIYFGGGTPSLLPPDSLGRLLDRIRTDRPLDPDAEITLEANPEDVTAPTAAAWRKLGINRVSLGAQSFDPGVLAWMHRVHGAEAIPRAVGTLRDAGFRNLSLDLIFALPSDLGRDWSRDLDQALALEPEHLSFYGLTVEPRTPLARWIGRQAVTPAQDDRWAAEFLLAHERLGCAGFEHYEVSNFARPGFRSRHNSAYWARRPYIGLGPSAHSGLGEVRQWNRREYADWARALLAGESPVQDREVLDAPGRELEDLYLGLRTREGLPWDRLAESVRTGWTREGWARREGDRLALTPEGWLRLDALVPAAIP